LNEYNFEGGSKSKRNSVLERINEESSQDKVKYQTTRTNMNLNYDNCKTLVLEMVTENREKKDKIIITQDGLVGSKRMKKDENDNNVYFGYKENGEKVNNYCIIYIILYYRAI